LAVKAIHSGDYNNLKSTHDQVNQYIQFKKLQIVGAPWEVYVTDPTVEKDTTKWVTEVYYPVAKQ
jgi:effector-binding domain-containing protein